MELIILLLAVVLFIKVVKAPVYFIGSFGQMVLFFIVICILLVCCTGM